MSKLTIEERFTLDAQPDVVWDHLIDPDRIVKCLPGAELTGQTADDTYEGVVKVKVGAVSIEYRGSVVFAEVDPGERFVRIEGKGRERSGSGNASMTMESRVLATGDGRTEVTVEAEVKVAGKIVRFGRGMIQTVSAELFSEFTERLSALVAGDDRVGGDGTKTAAGSEDGEADDGANDDASAGGRPREDDEEPEDNAVALLPLLFRSFRRWLKGLFGR